MRLICPNCGAQYEVPDEVIPEMGRDVQCSNCGDTWFQHHPGSEPQAESGKVDASSETWASSEEEREQSEVSDAEPSAMDVLREEASREEEARSQEEHDESNSPSDEDPSDASEEDLTETVEDDTPQPEKREIDPSVSDVLREEANREEEARSEDSRADDDSDSEDQPDEADEKPDEDEALVDKLNRLSAEDNIDPSSRSNLLPDVEEINSSLSNGPSDSDVAPVTDTAEPVDARVAAPGGFKRGFMVAVLVILLLVLLYQLAPIITRMVPALEGVLSAYEDAVDAGRIWLNGVVKGK